MGGCGRCAHGGQEGNGTHSLQESFVSNPISVGMVPDMEWPFRSLWHERAAIRAVGRGGNCEWMANDLPSCSQGGVACEQWHHRLESCGRSAQIGTTVSAVAETAV